MKRRNGVKPSWSTSLAMTLNCSGEDLAMSSISGITFVFIRCGVSWCRMFWPEFCVHTARHDTRKRKRSRLSTHTQIDSVVAVWGRQTLSKAEVAWAPCSSRRAMSSSL